MECYLKMYLDNLHHPVRQRMNLKDNRNAKSRSKTLENTRYKHNYLVLCAPPVPTSRGVRSLDLERLIRALG